MAEPAPDRSQYLQRVEESFPDRCRGCTTSASQVAGVALAISFTHLPEGHRRKKDPEVALREAIEVGERAHFECTFSYDEGREEPVNPTAHMVNPLPCFKNIACRL